MSGSKRTTGTLHVRRRKARFRAWHRGMREMDLLLGTFADARLDALPAAELDLFEDLLEVPDAELFKWFTGEVPVPAAHDTDLFRRIQAFCRVMPFG
ncbi:MAG: succinate dehydrogenase assembly factor 2 [Nitratireductor sp.]